MSRSWNGLVRGSALAVVVAAGLLSVLATGTGGGGTTGDGTGPAAFHMNIKRQVSGPNMLCPTTSVTWLLEPVTLTGSTGISVATQKSFGYAGGNVGYVAPFECNFNDSSLFPDIRPGSWKLTATTAVVPSGPVSVSCTKTATQGSPALANWTFNTAGTVLSCQ